MCCASDVRELECIVVVVSVIVVVVVVGKRIRDKTKLASSQNFKHPDYLH